MKLNVRLESKDSNTYPSYLFRDKFMYICVPVWIINYMRIDIKAIIKLSGVMYALFVKAVQRP